MSVVVEHKERAAPYRRPRPGTALLGRFGLLLGSATLCALTLLAAEAVVRRISPDYLVRTRGLHVFSETYGWAPRRGAGSAVDGSWVSLNARGYRGRELALPRTDDRTRIVVLGDSIAFGLGVSDEETFSALLDARDNGIEVANLAVQGYGPGQELLVLSHEGLRYEPDVVVLAFCPANDFADAVLPVALYDGSPKPRFSLIEDRLVLDDSALRISVSRAVFVWLSDYSQLFNRGVTLGQKAPLPTDWHARYNEAMRDEGYALRLSVALVRQMNALCQRRGIPFLVGVFPARSSDRVKESVLDRFYAALASEDIPVLDVSTRFRARGLRMNAVALDGIGHLNPLGHSIVSQDLEREIGSRVGRKAVRGAAPQELAVND
jgi:hypothetical protein